MARFGRRVLPRLCVALAATAAALFSGSTAATANAPVSSIRAQEWWLTTMHATDQLWPVSTGKGITIAEIDSGVKADHPDLVGQILPGQNFSGLPGGAETDANGHGTAMASLIAGTGKGWSGKGMYGLAPGASILPLRVVPQGANEAVFAESFAQQMSAALRAAADSSAQIINISMGQVENEPSVHSAVDYALSKGKLIVAAVGNDGADGNPVEYPAAFPGVVGVSETDKNGNVASESEHGSEVSLSAPGAGMYEACVGPSGYCNGHGTSDSTAITSASAALIWSVHPTWTADQVIRVLKNTANAGSRPGFQDPYYGYGLIRPRVALATPGDPGPADVNPLVPAAASAPAAPRAGGSAAASAPAGGARAAAGAGTGGGGRRRRSRGSRWPGWPSSPRWGWW
ncbi:S8 family serine peptidase [Streptacidiphilus sp. PB12-B1b]|uniref:S8 family serine peptidase n=1 Tax=Streptacidiphilus sp. PB12-B1b TaxID=2705012 RepID=UPI0015FB1E38|nr:S8 family serine peptidase [Streptacidiphilus sp. PB12-B1b]QMU79432.1 S8 family serine peptidase [Streptacidiphilus sp. PB12-B1b]